MSRDIPVGNDNMLIAFDRSYLLREFYFPHVGEENHTKGEPFRVGIRINSSFTWIPSGWRISTDYLEKEKRFARMINFRSDGSIEVDKVIDASLFGIFAFGAYSPGDEKVRSTMEQVYRKLWCKTRIGGLARYENDSYYRVSGKYPGNPWFIATLWLAKYYIAAARDEGDLSKALEILSWVEQRALPSGILAEQVNPETGEALSVSPLTWSHATFIETVQEYLRKTDSKKGNHG